MESFFAGVGDSRQETGGTENVEEIGAGVLCLNFSAIIIPKY